ncbi:MAG: hypothetical protein ABS98_00470 [Lysobacteraceae bacterium SCN 69-48]|nr:MAG: hypothetical protein ABS98_00470 [Xanthomonadaceae bacterium SCN 69-48]
MDQSEHPQTLAGRLKELRGDASQVEFARQLGIGRTTLIRYESGERVPDAEVLTFWSERGIDIDYLLTGTTKKLRNRLNAVKAATEMATLATGDKAKRAQLQEAFFKSLIASYDNEDELHRLVDDYLRCGQEDQSQIRSLAARLAQTPRKGAK